MGGNLVVRKGEQGKGALGSIVGLAVFLLVCYSIFHVLPPFITNFAFNDKLNELARLNRGLYTDEKILDMIMKEVRERELDDYITRSDVDIKTVETSRRISVEYTRMLAILPGVEKPYKFVDNVDQPLVF